MTMETEGTAILETKAPAARAVEPARPQAQGSSVSSQLPEPKLDVTIVEKPTHVAPTIDVPVFPFPLTRSGRYLYSRSVPFPPVLNPIPVETKDKSVLGLAAGEAIFADDVSALALYQQEEVQLDIDGRYPQMTVSGARSGALSTAVHWVASLKNTAPNTYAGPIWYKNGNAAAIPHNFVTATVAGGPFPATFSLDIVFTGGGAAAFRRSYSYQSAYRRKVEFEYDRVADAVAVTSIQTHAHPNHPATLPSETLSLETVYRRAGFDAAVSPGSGVIPTSASGPDALWTDAEMNDAMQIYWSRYANKPQWALWVLFAAMHKTGSSLGGIMFDDVGPNQRQGTAIFSNAFIATPPAGDPHPAEWVQRMRFWTAAHEMGHGFNLAHSWQKAAAAGLPGNPWIPLANEPLARSFMNYPYNVPGGQQAFFADFAYRFTDPELLFMRHAPERFVQMGNEAWFSNHGFREAAQGSNPDYELRLSVNTPDNRFDYLTPPMLEVALVNRSERPKVVAGERLGGRAGFTLIINPEGSPPPRQWLPYLRHCGEEQGRVLQPGEAIYDSIMVGAGRNGWDMSDPGRYCLQAVLEVDDQLVYSNQLSVTVAPPASREEERLAADFFTPQIGQLLTVNGSRAMDSQNKVLASALELKDNRVSKLAAVALATPLAQNYKLLEEGSLGDENSADGAEGAERRFGLYSADPGAVRDLIAGATKDGADDLVHAMGHVRFLRDAPLLAGALVDAVPQGLASFDDSQATQAAVSALAVSDALTTRLERKSAGLTA